MTYTIALKDRKTCPFLTWSKQKSWPWWCGCRSTGRLTNLATTQAQIHSNISIYEVLELVKGSVLQNQS